MHITDGVEVWVNDNGHVVLRTHRVAKVLNPEEAQKVAKALTQAAREARKLIQQALCVVRMED